MERSERDVPVGKQGEEYGSTNDDRGDSEVIGRSYTGFVATLHVFTDRKASYQGDLLLHSGYSSHVSTTAAPFFATCSSTSLFPREYTVLGPGVIFARILIQIEKKQRSKHGIEAVN